MMTAPETAQNTMQSNSSPAGMLHPELTASAREKQGKEVAQMGASAQAPCYDPCEVEMTKATGADYRHVPEMLNVTW